MDLQQHDMTMKKAFEKILLILCAIGVILSLLYWIL